MELDFELAVNFKLKISEEWKIHSPVRFKILKSYTNCNESRLSYYLHFMFHVATWVFLVPWQNLLTISKLCKSVLTLSSHLEVGQINTFNQSATEKYNKIFSSPFVLIFHSIWICSPTENIYEPDAHFPLCTSSLHTQKEKA